MTVSSITNRKSYSGDGSTTVFAYDFKVFADTDLKVILRASGGAETVQTLTTHYSVSGVGNDAGGNVTMVTAPASGETLVIVRNVPNTQETDYIENDPFPASSHEDALDKLTMEVQRLDEKFGRTPIIKETTALSDIEFPEPGADEVVKWNAGGTALETKAMVDLGGAVIGTDVQAWDAQLDDIAALTPTDGNFIVGDGTNWVVESGATARTSMGAQIQSDRLDEIRVLGPADGTVIVGDGASWVAETGATARASMGAGGGSAFSVHRNGTNQTGIAHQVYTKVQWTSEKFDTAGDFDSSTNHRFTPSEAGKYLFVTNVEWVSGADNVFMDTVIRKNGNGEAAGVWQFNGTSVNSRHVAAIVDMNGTTDYVEVFVRQDSGSNRDIFGGATRSYFTGMRIG
jgi:hypothetical protein